MSSTRPPINWRSEAFWDEHKLLEELERVFDYCDSCRICWTLCEAFPVLFDMVEAGYLSEAEAEAASDEPIAKCMRLDSGTPRSIVRKT